MFSEASLALKETSMSAIVNVSPASNADIHISEVIEKIAAYSREYHNKRPDAPPRHCIEIGAGKILGDLDQGQSRLVQAAITEMAARWIFPDQVSAAE